jgi:hypothetical protein
MPDEEIDKIVKEAANQHHPPYDDTAWGKMELLLDKHLPQKKDRKKPIIFLLFFLLLGGAVFFAIDNTRKKHTPAVVENTKDSKPDQINQTVSSASITPADAGEAGTPDFHPSVSLDQTTAAGIIPGNSAKRSQLNNNKQDDADNGQAYADGKKTRFDQKGRLAVKIKKPGVSSDDETVAKEKETPLNNDVVTNENIGAEKINTTAVAADPADKKEAIKQETIKTIPEKIITVEKPATEKNTTTAASKPKTSKHFADNIGITLSAGADASFIKLKNAGQLKPAYGAGLNYNLGKHLTIASGFYVSKKIYAAAPADYKFPGGYANPNLVNIEADCDVYEIPLSVYYNFKAAKKHSWLAGVSLSSFLMKKETYDYQYKTPSGQSYNYVNTVTNENKHYFSVLTISGGYQYKLNNRLAFVAEPYVKMPLTGIGLGKIKLNSTGVLVTAVVKPFAKGKK